MNSDAHQPSGLVLDVYRTSRRGDCTNGGVSATHADLLLVGILDERRTFTAGVDVLPTEYAPHGARRHFLGDEGPTRPTVALQICARSFFVSENYAALVPVEWDHEANRYRRTHSWVMFGGNYAATSDSRLSELAAHFLHYRASILPIHDRVER